jgi:predicted MFS family arabinose efflux permease
MNGVQAARASPQVQASLVLLLCFSLNMVGRGLSDAYAVFLVPLGEEFAWSRTALAGVFATALLVFSASAPFAGLVLDQYGHRAVYLGGLCCQAAGLLLAGSATSLWHLYVLVGVGGGIALSTLGMIPAATLLGRWYDRRLAMAIGLAYTGIGCGSLLVVPAAQFLVQTEGWRMAYRTLGALLAVVALVVAALPWQRIARAPGRGHGQATAERTLLPDLRAAMRRPLFFGLCVVFMFTSMAMYMVTLQLVAFLIDVGLSPLQAAGSLGLVGALSVVGMIGAGWLAGRIGFARTGVGSFMLTLCGVALLVAMHRWPAALMLPAFVVLFGISQGTRGPLVTTVAAREFKGRAAGAVLGIVTAASGIGGAIGSVSAGWLYDVSGSYDASLAVAAASLLVAAMPFVVCREFRQR